MASKSTKRPANTFVDSPGLEEPDFYSHAVSIDGTGRLILTSGQVGARKDGSFPSTFKEQVEQAFVNMEMVLQAAGASIRDVVKLKWYCVDWDSNTGMKELLDGTFKFLTNKYGVRFRPLTTLVPVPALAFPHIKFEVEATAAVGGLGRPIMLESKVKQHPVPAVMTDVVVVGGGFSGLQAAYDIHSSGRSVIVLEAKGRVGGRSWTYPLKSGPGRVELGATWINAKTQPKVYNLVKHFGLKTVEQYTTGEGIYQSSDGTVFRSGALSLPDSASASPGPGQRFNLQDMRDALEAAQTETDLHNVGKHDPAKDTTWDEWVRAQQFTPYARDFLLHFVRVMVCREPEEVGAHYALDYIKSGLGFDSLNFEGPQGAQSLKVKEGTSAVADHLAASLPDGSVYLHSPVESVDQYGYSCLISTSNGLKVESKKVVIAIPTHTYENIHFSPPLPYNKRAIVSRTKAGKLAKVTMTYSRPWWRDLGLVGTFTSFVGPIHLSWDISDPSTSQYSLALFICGDAVSKNGSKEHGRLVGDLLELNEQIWTREEHIMGAPTSPIGPGDLAKYGIALRDSFRNVHFGGGETAYEWKGYLEGALRAGSRVAEEVVKALPPTSKL